MEPKDKPPAPWLTHTYGDTERAWTGIQGPKHHAMISTQAQSHWQMCTWRQLCHLHTLALAEHVGPVRNSRASLSPFFKTSFSTACPLLSICLNDLWTPGTRDVPFCSKPTVQTPLFWMLWVSSLLSLNWDQKETFWHTWCWSIRCRDSLLLSGLLF